MSDSNKSGKGGTIAIAIVLIIILLSSPIIIFTGILTTTINFLAGIFGTVIDEVLDWWDSFKSFFGFSIIKNGMYIYPLKRDSVTQLKQQLEAQSIRTDEAGFTELMLRKMILAQAVTSFTKDTLCVAEVESSEILQGTGYSDLNEYLETLEEKASKDVWPIDDPNYSLYYVTDKFFYFKDEDNMIGQGADKYYLGLIGSINIKTSEGSDLEYVSQQQFNKAQQDFEALDDDVDNTVRKDLLNKYTIDSNGDMVVHKIVKNTNMYKYTFTNNNSGTIFEKPEEANFTNQYNVLTVPLDIQGSVDTSKYTISIELLINLLDISSSPEFVDKFIDYALEESEVTITAYLVEDEETS